MLPERLLNPSVREQVYLAGLLHSIGTFYPHFDTRWQQLRLPAYQTGEVGILAKATRLATHIDLQTNTSDSVDQPLNNLFGELLIARKLGAATAFDFHPLSLDRGTVLREKAGDLHMLRAGFAAQLAHLPTGTWVAFTESLFHLIRQHTWCIPASSGAAFRSISLFHHLKLTAAFAQCLYDFEHREERSATNNRLPLQLLCVDLSGIQSFIYNIGSRQAAKSLKGRSFSLQVVLDGIASKLVSATGTTSSHLVYSSGGKFFMLLPNTQAVNEVVAATKKEVQAAIWDEYKGNLFVCFGQVPFTYHPTVAEQQAIELTNGKRGSLSNLWQAVTQKAAEEKTQKHSAVLRSPDRFAQLFMAAGKGGTTGQCAVTGQEGPLVTLKGGAAVHPTVGQQIKIGKALADTRYLRLGDGPYNLLSGTLPAFDLDNRRISTNGTEYSQIMQPNTTTSFLQSASMGTLVRSFRFYGGSRQAASVIHGASQPKNFEELTGLVRQDPDDDDSPVWREKTEGNYHRLAVLRMDVDSLGELFTGGFTGPQATFSAYATLSGLLDWFFSGYLNTIHEQEGFRDWVNIIYSGGDDVFAVGRWDKVIAFAEQIQADFKRFTNRPELTISAGIVLIKPRYPIGKAATQAGEAEDIAKDHVVTTGQKKNALCLFGVAVNWDTEWPFVVEYHQKITEWLQAGKLTKGILQKLFAYYDIHARNEAERCAARQRGQPEPPPDLAWQWNAAYTLSRHRTDKNKAAIDDLKQLIFTRVNDGNVRFEALAMAMRWAELTIRDYPKNKTEHGTSN